MKKLLIFIILIAGGFFGYKFLLEKKTVLEIKADKNITTQNSMDVNAPAMNSTRYGKIDGTVTNVSDDAVSNIVLKYKLNAKPVEARIDRLEPGESKNFSTQSIMLTHYEVTFFLEDMIYE